MVKPNKPVQIGVQILPDVAKMRGQLREITRLVTESLSKRLGLKSKWIKRG